MHNQNNDILTLLKEIKDNQQEIKRRLNSQDTDIENLKQSMKDGNKYTISQILKAIGLAIPTIMFVIEMLKFRISGG